MILPTIPVSRLDELERIDSICDRFEQQWKAGHPPRLEQLLESEEDCAETDELFRELLLIELDYRKRRGDTQILADFYARFPQRRALVAEIFHFHESLSGRLDAETGGKVLEGSSSGPRCVDRFELREEIGRGASGVVYRAWDPLLERDVAVKIAYPHMIGKDDASRIRREARTIGRLSHPGIVPVFEVGSSEIGCYIVMELIRGPTLAAVLPRHAPLGFRSSARLVAAIADALHHAHERGVVHRDVKPSNILLSGIDAAEADSPAALDRATPCIADFGLARNVETATLGSLGSIVGTPGYMSPEQALGNSRNADARSDIYSLGVILFELLTGRLPFRGDQAAVIRQIAFDEVPSVRRVNRSVPRELAAVCHKCLERSPEDRYPSAQALADDLRAWLDHRPVSARSTSPVVRLRKFVVRRRRAVALAATMVVMLSLLAATLSWHRASVAESRRIAANALVDNLLNASDQELPSKLNGLRADLPNSADVLRTRLADSTLPARAKGRLQLAMLSPDTPMPIELWQAALVDAGPKECSLLLRPGVVPAESAADLLWRETEPGQGEGSDGRRFRQLVALAALDADNPQWDNRIADLAYLLLAQDQHELAAWTRLVRPLAGRLRQPLFEAYSEGETEVLRVSAAIASSELLRNEPADLEKLLLLAQPAQLPVLVKAVQPYRELVCRNLVRLVCSTKPPLFDSVDSENLAMQRARALLALVKSGRLDEAWRLLPGETDPRLATYFILWAEPAGIDAQLLAEELERQTEPDVLYTILCALVQFPKDVLPPALIETLGKRSLELHEDSPRAHVHAAAGLLARKLGFTEQLEAANRRHARLGIRPGYEWYVTPLGVTMILFPGPRVVRIGAPRSERGWRDIEPFRTVEIPYSFAIGMYELTYRQLEAAGVSAERDPLRSPSLDCPVAGISQLQALEYCLQFNRAEGIELDDYAIMPIGTDEWRMDAHKGGYRLPTNAEWEFACRAGTTTSRFFGTGLTDAAELYAWFSSRTTMRPVGTRLPNQRGFFDVFGNASEWVFSTFPYDPKRDGTGDVAAMVTVIHRGGSYSSISSDFRAASTAPFVARGIFSGMGFRLARTLELEPQQENAEKPLP